LVLLVAVLATAIAAPSPLVTSVVTPGVYSSVVAPSFYSAGVVSPVGYVNPVAYV
ncbi:hypothetical protein BDFB_008771, partial [Asbolus verrucosus]